MDCKYLFKYPSFPGFKVKVVFKSFELELETNCKFDGVAVYDGATTGATKLGNENGYCGTSMPPSFVSSGNELLIVFKTDGSSTRKGFEFTYVRSKFFMHVNNSDLLFQIPKYVHSSKNHK